MRLSTPINIQQIHIPIVDLNTPPPSPLHKVMASNDIGQRSEQFKVMCEVAPEITRGLDPETEKKLSNDQTFEVRASGSPSPIARW